MGLACSIPHTLVSGALMPKLNSVQNNNSEDLSAFSGYSQEAG